MADEDEDATVPGWRPDQSAYEGRTGNPRSDIQAVGRERTDGSDARQPGGIGGSTDVTNEVGDEGGGTGDVEVERTSVATGSEATSTVVPSETRIEERRGKKGEGRRSP